MFSTNQIRSLIASGNTKLFYKDYTWRKLALDIIAEHKHECYMCKKHGKYTRATMVHHVKHLKQHPELAYSRTYKDKDGEHIQLMPLCHECHEKIHERGVYGTGNGFTNEEKW